MTTVLLSMLGGIIFGFALRKHPVVLKVNEKFLYWSVSS